MRGPWFFRENQTTLLLGTVLVVGLLSFRSGADIESDAAKLVQRRKEQSAHTRRSPNPKKKLVSANARPATRGATAKSIRSSDSLGTSSSSASNARAPLEISDSAFNSGMRVAALTTQEMPLAQSTALGVNVEKNSSAKRFGGDITATYSGSALESSDLNRTSELDLELAPWVAIGKSYKIDADIDVTRDMNNYRETKVGDARLGFMHDPFKLSKLLKYRPKVILYLPVDADKREINSFRGAVGASNRLMFEKGIFSGYYQLGVTKNFYQYETTGDSGESNPAWALGNTLNTVITLGTFYVNISGNVTQRWTFETTPTSSFEMTEEFGVSIDSWSIGAGHTNGASLYQANGADSNFSFANGNTSKFYLSANYGF